MTYRYGVLVALAAAIVTTTPFAAEIRVQCYSDGNE
jgi:hypothetical protein